jgi:hypothetical protein
LECHGRKWAAVILLAIVAGISAVRAASASDLGPATGQHVGKVISWDSATERLVLVEASKGKAPRRITLWTDPQTAVAAPRCEPQDLFGHEKGCRGLSLADLKVGDRVEVEWRRAGRRHAAVSLRRLP